MAIVQLRRHPPYHNDESLAMLVDGGLKWLAGNQNDDGGWGDTVKSFSNISTTMLAHAVYHAADCQNDFAETVTRAKSYIDKAGGVDAVVKRYGKDKTFSVPILTHCALADLVDWKQITSLPFELACIPARFYKTVRLPVVSYALPALIAIGQVKFHFHKPWNPIARIIRTLSIKRTLKVLTSIQPPHGGFLEAAPLTSFVTMSLAAIGQHEHIVARRGLQFLVASVRPDGSWPIDTNLATWGTTLAVNALRSDLPDAARRPILDWLLNQQYQAIHPFTNADPGGWAWTDLPGGVPDADDTPGAILAVARLSQRRLHAPHDEAITSDPTDRSDLSGSSELEVHVDKRHLTAAADNALATLDTRLPIAHGITWLMGLQNRDGGWPTFCKGWGTLPFDRSSADITAHALRALVQYHDNSDFSNISCQLDGRPVLVVRSTVESRIKTAINQGFRFLEGTQQDDGSWYPLWFGNQHHPDEENPTYGTGRVLMAYRDAGMTGTPAACRGFDWLKDNQNEDGGWGGQKDIVSTIEETSIAVEALLSDDAATSRVLNGLQWLIDRVEADAFTEPTPIGFYFAKLWYFERLYPLTFLTSALNRSVEHLKNNRFEPIPSPTDV